MTCRTVLRSSLAFIAAILLSVSANAQLFRAYLAPTGVDTNPCTLPAPCRLLPAALAAVADGGEIWMLDSANYNTATVNITKSVSILAVPGAVGSVLATSGDAINIAMPGGKVALRNLVIVPLPGVIGPGGPNNGVSMTGAATLIIEHCLIANLPSYGVYVSGTGTLKIANSILRNNGTAVWLENGVSGEVSGTQMLSNGFASIIANSFTNTMTTVSVSDSVISGGTIGVRAISQVSGAVGRVLLTRSTVEGTQWALYSSTVNNLGSTLITVNGSTVTNNTNAWYQVGTGSAIKTLGNNNMQDNTTFVGVLTPASLQ
jgi:hypothetical protein